MARTSVKPTPQKQMVQVQYRPLSALKKHPKNPRTIKDSSFKKLVTSIRENPDYFEARPIILSDRTGELIIIAGNQRFEAARDIGIKDVPTALLPELTEEKEREIMIRDNIANGEWDWDMLANEWDAAELGEWGLDVPGWGVDADGADGFELADGDKPPFQNMTFTFADAQAEEINKALDAAKQGNSLETFGNENSNGNAMYRIACEWLQQKI